jgi:hypothetical protein
MRLLQLWRKYGLSGAAYNEIADTIRSDYLNPHEVAPTYYLAKKVENNTIPKLVIPSPFLFLSFNNNIRKRLL